MSNKQKLELTWIGKNNPEYDIANIEPRILEERADLSYGDKESENMIIHGDNLLALKALLPEYEGKIKCIYIDPPYNTGSAFEHYDDNVEHSTWLELLKPRLEIIRQLLHRTDGSLWVSIDDYEVGYLRVLLDEVFGRACFVATNVWQKRYSRENRESIGDAHEYVLTYATNPERFKIIRNKLPLGPKQLSVYKNPNNDPKGQWRAVSFSAQGFRPNQMYEIVSPITGKKHHPPEGSCWKVIESEYKRLLSEGRMYFGKSGDAVPSRIQYLKDIDGIVPWTWWPHEEVGHTDESKKEIQNLFGKTDAFDTPKPERLIQRILQIATNPDDIVLDSFLGSGTTVAVAQKMGRKYIGIEMGEHAYTLCKVRMDKVVSGTDQGGISNANGWKGGGGFKFYELAPSFVAIDEFGNPVIDSYFSDTKLISAMCKLTNYTFAPSATEYWKQGKSQSNNSIYVTTQMLSVAMVQQIVSHLGKNETLLICPKKFEPGCKEVDTRITIKKIPQSILKACQFGKKEYLLPIKERAMEEVDEEDGDDN